MCPFHGGMRYFEWVGGAQYKLIKAIAYPHWDGGALLKTSDLESDLSLGQPG